MATPNLFALTSVKPKLVSSQLGSTSIVTVYTVLSGTAAMINRCVLANTSTSSQTVSVYAVPVGGAADVTHRVVSNYVIAPNDTAIISELDGFFLEEASFIAVSASTAAVVDVTLSVLEMS